MLSDVQIAKPFIKATCDVLQTMANLTATPGKPYVKKNSVAEGDISAIVGITGDRRGTISVTFSRACAIAVVKGMLGDDIEDILLDTQDAVGEVANMISGQARAGLSALGLSLQGSTPTVVVGDKHIIRHITSGPIVAIPFSAQTGSFTVEFCFE